MKYLSVCSGIEAATVAWHELGWQPVGFSEIEKFPNAVLEHHYPDVPNYGDMTDHENWEGICDCTSKHDGQQGQRNSRQWGSGIHSERDARTRRSCDSDKQPGAGNCEKCKRPIIDVLVGGTPCQSFSVAGLRKGMADPRGNLALIYLAIADQYRPRWLVWENVPGVLSSDGGRDFGSIIGGMVELGYCPAWRVLDAQYFGVPQRRRRVFVVASSRDWRDSAKVLFEPESLLRNPAPRREPRQGTAGNVTHSLRGRGFDASEDGTGRGTPLIPDIANPLTARMHKGINTTCDEGQTPIPVIFNLHGGSKRKDRPDGGFYTEETDVAKPLDTAGINPTANQGGTAVAVAHETGHGYWQQKEYSGTLRAEGENRPSRPSNVVQTNMAVRRLMPIECERLQGFPDNYTNIPGASDSARYKALGNSMAVPVMHWIGKRINDYEM